MTQNERIVKTLENGVNRIKTAETTEDLYLTLRTIAAGLLSKNPREF